MKSLCLFLVCGALSAVAAPEFKPRQVVKPFEAITNPKVVSVAQSKEFVRDDELVLGVVVNPVLMLGISMGDGTR